jgi:hypothetical protein
MTPEIIDKLEEVFALGGTDKEACFYAGISEQTLYDYQKLKPEFVERKEGLKGEPILKARRTIVAFLNQPTYATWYLERKRKNEFAARTEHTGDAGEPIKVDISKALEKVYGGTGAMPNNS